MKTEHAVVIGGSVAGLLAAGAAARHCERVTVLERDELEDAPTTRKGAPQGNQIHILLPVGERMIREIFPGLREELLAAGCVEYDQAGDIVLLTQAGWRPRIELELARAIAFRRPLLEWLVRRRATSLENVDVRAATVAGLELDERGENVVGVRLKDGETVTADLVVDAGGRGTKSPRWLTELGFEAPREDEVRVHMGYATQFVELPENPFEGGVRGIAAVPTPANPTGAVVIPADNGVFTLTAVGMMKNYPPADREGMLDFLARASTPLVAEIARASVPVSEVHTYRQPGNLWRRWDLLERRPGRFLASGDAVASFNPVYGQGMTMAALAATLLDRELADPAATPERLPARFQDSLSEGIAVAFGMAAAGDALYEGAELRNFEPPSAEDRLLMARLDALANRDLEVLTALHEASLFLRPEALESEEIKRRIEAAPDPEPGAEAAIDPRAYPLESHRPGADRQEPATTNIGGLS